MYIYGGQVGPPSNIQAVAGGRCCNLSPPAPPYCNCEPHTLTPTVPFTPPNPSPHPDPNWDNQHLVPTFESDEAGRTIGVERGRLRMLQRLRGQQRGAYSTQNRQDGEGAAVGNPCRGWIRIIRGAVPAHQRPARPPRSPRHSTGTPAGRGTSNATAPRFGPPYNPLDHSPTPEPDTHTTHSKTLAPDARPDPTPLQDDAEVATKQKNTKRNLFVPPGLEMIIPRCFVLQTRGRKLPPHHGRCLRIATPRIRNPAVRPMVARHTAIRKAQWEDVGTDATTSPPLPARPPPPQVPRPPRRPTFPVRTRHLAYHPLLSPLHSQPHRPPQLSRRAAATMPWVRASPSTMDLKRRIPYNEGNIGEGLWPEEPTPWRADTSSGVFSLSPSLGVVLPTVGST